MNALRQIPLHVLLLAGLAGPLGAQDNTGAAAAAKPAATKPAAGTMQAYSGLSVSSLSDADRTKSAIQIPDGVGLGVVLVDPKGPAAGMLEVGDVLTRFDDQVLVSADQFRTLVRMRKAGDKVKLVFVREAEAKTVELELGEKAAPERRVAATPRVAGSPAPGSPMSITINGQQIDLGNVPGGSGTVTQVGPGHVVIIGPNQGLPPEVKKQLEEMRARGLPIPPLDAQGMAIDPAQGAGKGSTQQFSKSFSFSLGGPGATTSSSSIASDDHGTVSLEQKDGKKHAVIKDKDGNVTFDGDVTTDELRAKMPAAARDRLKLVEGSTFSIDGLGGKPGATKPEGSAEPEKPKKKRNPKEGA
jgi:hypothetical protein